MPTQHSNLAKHHVKAFANIFNKKSNDAAAFPLEKRIFASGKPVNGNIRQRFCNIKHIKVLS